MLDANGNETLMEIDCNVGTKEGSEVGNNQEIESPEKDASISSPRSTSKAKRQTKGSKKYKEDKDRRELEIDSPSRSPDKYADNEDSIDSPGMKSRRSVDKKDRSKEREKEREGRDRSETKDKRKSKRHKDKDDGASFMESTDFKLTM